MTSSTNIWQRWAAHVAFQRIVLVMILLAALIVGLETNPVWRKDYASLFHLANTLILGVFIIEATVKLGAQGRRYFVDPWNIFDFLIVLLCLIPSQGAFAPVLRLVRVLRVLRMISVLPRLQLLVNALLKSIPSMGYVGLLLALLIYIYAVIGTFFFGVADPVHFGNLGRSILSLFQTATLEGWVDLLRAQFGEGGIRLGPVLFFVTFIMFGTMIMLNLFIGIVLNGMQEVQDEAEAAERALKKPEEISLADELRDLEKEVDRLKERIQSVRRKAG